jgi:hypothetical protein
MKNTSEQATINQITFADTGIYASATCGKISAIVCITEYNVRVICQNSAHKTWRGFGRSFESISEALAGYKTPQMKAIISAVDSRNT